MINNIFLLFNLGTGEILIIVFVVLLLFGGKKIPELMRGLGKGVRSFKEGMDDIKNEIERPVSNDKNKSDSSEANTKKE
ncbi:MAG: twin-arginine translocase TatA/TatE family subunit [Muribaculaceae bacterium]